MHQRRVILPFLWVWANQWRSYNWARASELNSNFNYANCVIFTWFTCQVCSFEMAFQKRSKGRQLTLFDCLDVNQSASCACKRQRQQHSDETDEQTMHLVSNDIRTTNDGFNSACTSVTSSSWQSSWRYRTITRTNFLVVLL